MSQHTHVCSSCTRRTDCRDPLCSQSVNTALLATLKVLYEAALVVLDERTGNALSEHLDVLQRKAYQAEATIYQAERN